MEILTKLNIPFDKKDWAKSQAVGKLTWDPVLRSWFFRGAAKDLPATLRPHYTPPPIGAPAAPHPVMRPSAPIRPVGSEFHVLCLPYTYQQFATTQGARWNSDWRVSVWYGIKANLPIPLTGFEPKPLSYECYVQDKLNNRRATVLPPTKSIVLRTHQVDGVREITRSFATGYPGFLLADEVGLGKAQPLTAKVLTPRGWTTMGALRVGDDVVDPDGGVAKVTGIFPQGTKEVFKVTMADKSSTECCDDHLWLVKTGTDRTRGTERVLPLKAIRGKLSRPHGKSKRLSRFFSPVAQPVTFDHPGTLPIDPWLLGVLIGNGYFRCGQLRVSITDPDLLAKVRSRLPASLYLKRSKTCDWSILPVVSRSHHELIAQLSTLGLSGRLSVEKSIPEAYRFAPIAARLALLRGLMDTDGDVNAMGACISNTSSPLLAVHTAELVRSLGGIVTSGCKPRPKYRGQVRFGKPAYRLNIRLPVNPCSIPAKAGNWKMPCMARPFKQITSGGLKPVQCISVSSKRHLYITDDYIVTHNTHTAWASILSHFKHPIKIAVIAPLSVHPGWRDSILAQGNGGHTVVILNYERLRNLYDEPEAVAGAKKIGKRRTLKKIANQGTPKDFQVYIWDESHYMKNLEAARSKLGVGLYRRGTHHLWLSATAGQNPMELGYLLPLLRAKTDGVIDLTPPAPKDFEAWYQSAGLRVKRGAFGKWQLGSTPVERDEDCRKTANILWSPDAKGVRGSLRRLPSDIAGWPELQRILWPVELSDDEQRQYDKEWKQFLIEFRAEKASGKGATPGATPGAAVLLRFRMKASLLRAKHTAEFAEDLIDNGHQVAISVEWQGTLEEIGKELTKRGIEFARITGKEIGDARENERRKYQLGTVPVVIFTVKEGINLQEGELQEPDKKRAQIDHDIRWSPINMHQIDGRSHRNGKFAKVYWGYAEGSKEMDVAESLLAKLKGMKTLMGESDLTLLSELEKILTG